MILVMDAAVAASTRDGRCRDRERRERRWSSGSMSQRLEEIVAALMRPVRDLKQNFNIDLSLLEEYLTEAGFQHLNGEPDDFATIAMLVQQCALIYGKKVDFYEQSVYDMVDKSTQANAESHDADEPAAADAETPSGRRRKRRHSEAFREFAAIDLEPAPNIKREMETVRPPPTLPKTYIEFERPPMMEWDARLTDYQGNEIGVVSDFHVNWNIKDGMIVDDLDSGAAISKDMVVPIEVAVLDEIQRLSPHGSDSGIEHTEPTDDCTQPIDAQTITETVVEHQTKKRERREVDDRARKKRKMTKVQARRLDYVKMWKEVRRLPVCLTDVTLDMLEAEALEGSAVRWHRRLVARGLRKLAVDCVPATYEFKGFQREQITDIMGMTGYTPRELKEQSTLKSRWLACMPTDVRLPMADDDMEQNSGDDGFFDATDLTQLTDQTTCVGSESSEQREELQTRVEAWHALVAPRVAEAEAHGTFDVHQYSQRVLDRLPRGEERQFAQVVRSAPQHDLCRYFLATLFLANTGNIKIVKTAPSGEVGGFDIQLKSRDTNLYSSTNPFD